MATARTSLRNAAIVAASTLGRFGATKDNSPEAFEAGVEIEGLGPAKNASRHSKMKPTPKRVRLSDPDLCFTPDVRKQMLQSRRNNEGSQVVGSMRGDDWIKENRRLRAAGLGQNRYIRIFDLYVPETSRALAGK